MILLYFLLVFLGVMTCAHFLFRHRSSRSNQQHYRERPLQALLEHYQQNHTRGPG